MVSPVTVPANPDTVAVQVEAVATANEVDVQETVVVVAAFAIDTLAVPVLAELPLLSPA